jgi:hypothetical protein
MINNTERPAILLTGAPAELTFTVSSALSTVGEAPNQALRVVSPGPAGAENLVLEFDGLSLDFIFGTVNEAFPLILTPYSSGSFASYAGRLAVELARHPTLSAYFTITHVPGSEYIWLKPKGRGSAYDLSFGAGSTAAITGSFTTADDDVYHTPAQVHLQMLDEDGILIEESIADGMATAETNSLKATFYELPHLLKTHLHQTDVPVLPLESTLPYYTRKYSTVDFNVWATLDDTTTRIRSTRNNDFSVDGLATTPFCDAGAAIATQGDFAADFYQDYVNASTQKFLSTRGSSRITRAGQPQWLSFIFKTTGTHTLKFTILATSGPYTLDVDFTVPAPALVHLPVGLPQQAIEAAVASGSLVSYEVGVWKSGGYISEQITYVKDSRYFHHPRFFIFENSLGGIDTFCATGDKLPDTRFSRTTTEQVRSSATRTADGIMEMVLNESEDSFILHTGYFETAEEARWLKDLLLSRHVAEIEEVVPGDEDYYYRQPMRKCIVAQESTADPADMDFAFAREIRMRYADKPTHVQRNGDPEIYYDSEVELHLVISNLSSSPRINVTHIADYIAFELNGLSVPFTAGQQSITTAGTYVLRIKAHQLGILVVSTTNCDVQINIRKLDARALQVLSLSAQDEILLDYFIERPSRVRKLSSVTMAGSDAAGLEALLIFFARVYQLYGNLNTLTLTGYSQTPAGMGAAAKTYLTGAGVTVNTN